jgi:hypothetical protein
MTAPPPPTTTELEWVVRTIALGGIPVLIARLQCWLHLPTGLAGQPVFTQRAWLDTAAPLSVVPCYVRNRGLVWQPLPGVRTTWAGQSSAVGFTEIWLPTLPAYIPRGPLRLLAKFPDSDPPGQPLPLLLGLEFLLAHRASLCLLPPPQQGALIIP